MPQANTAQREPSMEEILASIRRIIEDGDAAPKRGDKTGAEPPYSVDLNGGDDDEPEPRMDAFRDEFAPELAAAVAAINADHSAGTAAPDVLMDEVVAIPEIARMPPRPDRGAAPMPAESPAGSPAGRYQRHEASVAPVALADELLAVDLADQDLPDDGLHDFGERVAERRPSLLSDRPGRQVAAAFGELSEAFAASRRRSFDEMAEEMMRPMLQDWLDNNLPHLVERLVREEIERIARGGPR